MADRPIAFGPKAARRIAETVRRVEAQPYQFPQPPKQVPRISGGGAQYVDGIVTSGISAANTNTSQYGSGTVQPVWPSLNTNSNTWFWVNSNSFGGTVTCLNFSANSGTVPTNSHIGMIQRQTANGSLMFEMIWKDC